ncbi:MAG: ABC transporter permease [Erysipelotrichaceae bacterium]
MGKYVKTFIAPVADTSLDITVIDDSVIEKKRCIRVSIGRIAVFVVIFGLWELLARMGIIETYYFSSPFRIISTGYIYFTQQNLIVDILTTALETIIGFLTGTFVGAMIGMSFWWNRSYADISEPYLIILNALPKLALAPIVIVIFGIGYPSKIIVSFLMTVITCAISVFTGVKGIDKATETLMYSLGATKWQVFNKVVIPSTMPSIIGCLRLNISLALSGAFIGEYISSRRGLGHIISYASSIMNNDLIWVGIFIMAVMAMILYGLVTALEKWMTKHFAVLNPK